MILEGMHEKNIFAKDFPFRLELNTQSDFTYPIHWHAAIELLFMEKNGITVTVNNREFYLEEGDILFIAGGDTHGFPDPKNSGKRIFIIFEPSAFNTLGSSIITPLISSTFTISGKDNPFHGNLISQINRIVESYSRKDFGYQLFLCARIYDILAIISSFLTEKTPSGNGPDKVKKIQGLEKLSEAFKYIEANYMNDISLSDAAKAVGFSESYFSRLFKDISEKTFSSFLNEYRIRQAEGFLIKSGMSVSEIAYTVGFNSIVTFNRAFKALKGCSPSTYKKIGIK